MFWFYFDANPIMGRVCVSTIIFFNTSPCLSPFIHSHSQPHIMKRRRTTRGIEERLFFYFSLFDLGLPLLCFVLMHCIVIGDTEDEKSDL